MKTPNVLALPTRFFHKNNNIFYKLIATKITDLNNNETEGYQVYVLDKSAIFSEDKDKHFRNSNTFIIQDKISSCIFMSQWKEITEQEMKEKILFKKTF